MASHDDAPRDLLLAYRAQQGPPSRAAAHNWEQLVRRIDAGEPAPELRDDEPTRPRVDPRSRAWAFGLAAAAAALIAARFAWPGRFSAEGRDVGAAAAYHHEPGGAPQAVQPASPPPAPAPQQPVPPAISEDSPPPVTIHRPGASTMSDKPSSDLARELAAVRAAGLAVRDGDGEAALRLADDYLAGHPRGALVPEARLRRIEALCLLARQADARRDIDAFLADYPHSPLRPRVESACK